MESELDQIKESDAAFESNPSLLAEDATVDSITSIVQPERDPRIPVRKGAIVYIDSEGRTVTRLPMSRTRRISPDNVGSSDWGGARTFMRSISGRREI